MTRQGIRDVSIVSHWVTSRRIVDVRAKAREGMVDWPTATTRQAVTKEEIHEIAEGQANRFTHGQCRRCGRVGPQAE